MLLSTHRRQASPFYGGGEKSSSSAWRTSSKRSWSAAHGTSSSTTSTGQEQRPQRPMIHHHAHDHPALVQHHGAMAATTSYPCIAAGGTGPLSFPPPRFSEARREVDQNPVEGCYTLVSQATGRRWRAINSLRECQFGKVLRAMEVTTAGETPVYYAIKELSLDRMREMQGRTHEDPLREVSAMQYLSGEGHANVIRCTEALRDQERIYIVTPYYSGGELFGILTDRGRFVEDEARPLFRQVLDGLGYLKRHGICHRDVSLENLLMDDGNRVTIIDFGLALRIPRNTDGRATALLSQGLCGKQHYISPEVLLNSDGFDGFAVDVWACGIMLFIMLTGVPPFELALPSRDQRCRVIAAEERLAELLSMWRMPLSPEVVDLMQSCLRYAPERRSTIETLRRHPWVTA